MLVGRKLSGIMVMGAIQIAEDVWDFAFGKRDSKCREDRC